MKYNILAIKLALWVKSPKDNSYLALLITFISLKLVLPGIILLHAHSQVVYHIPQSSISVSSSVKEELSLQD